MKIEGPKGPQGAGKAKKSGGSGVGDIDFSQYVTGGAQDAQASVSAQSIAQLDTLLAVQGAEDPSQRAARKRSRERAHTILTVLDKVRVAMITGDLTLGHMIDVADVVAAHRDKIHDPQMTALMDEVDLRAQVELAKMRVALDGTRA